MVNHINNKSQQIILTNKFREIVNHPANAHFMLDVETDGVEASRNSITSLALVQFIPGGDIFYHTKLHVRVGQLPNRIKDMDTMKWRNQNNVEEGEFGLEHANSIKILELIRTQLKGTRTKEITQTQYAFPIPHIYSCHKEFDLGFLNSYFEYRHAEKPWHYRNTFDINDLIFGMGLSRYELIPLVKSSRKWKDTIKEFFDGEEAIHNAFYDCLLQIETFNYALRLRGFVK